MRLTPRASPWPDRPRGFFLPINAGAIPVFIPARSRTSMYLNVTVSREFGSNLFLDEALAEISANDLMQVAD